MFEIQTAQMLNQSKQGNFVFEPVDNVCNVQIFDELKMETCGEMVARLNQIIGQLPSKPIFNTSAKIESPYDISPDTFVFDVAIDSSGGHFIAYKAIASMFALAKSKGAIIRTSNIGQAASCASMLAIQGTPGYRIMSEFAYNMIHYGDSSARGNREFELETATRNKVKDRAQMFSVYERYTKLTEKEMDKFKTVESSGTLFANQCLIKHLCDWILTNNGELIGRKR